ncbi:MAG: aminotransferase class V-fold PLP-dependent enzyme [Deltaproteobacteria bacterium]|nr:aminotransferase class V-fold PLP-dependent enzyme [Deltaproteobacteria bacterium]
MTTTLKVPAFPAVPSFDLGTWREQIPLLRSFVAMNNCSQGPQTIATREAARGFLDTWNQAGMNWPGWMEEVERARTEFASLIHASPEEVAVSTSVSAAAASVASALDFSAERPRVVVSGAEFPTVAHVWQSHRKYGAEVDRVSDRDGVVALEDYDSVVGERTRVVSACHGDYRNGERQDIAALAQRVHRKGALIFVDAYQTLGIEEVDVRAMDVDFLACGNLKYLMGTAGIAFLYVRRELIDQLEPAVTGWFGRANPFGFEPRVLDWADTARRFDTGTPAVINAYIASAGMAMIRQVGPAAIAAWGRSLSCRLLEGAEVRGLTVLGSRDATRKTPSTAILCHWDSHRVSSHQVEAGLRLRGVLASARGPAIRLAPHFYSTFEDVDRALDALVEVLKEKK